MIYTKYKLCWDEWGVDADGDTYHSVKQRTFIELDPRRAKEKALTARDWLDAAKVDMMDATGIKISSVRVLEIKTRTVL